MAWHSRQIPKTGQVFWLVLQILRPSLCDLHWQSYCVYAPCKGNLFQPKATPWVLMACAEPFECQQQNGQVPEVRHIGLLFRKYPSSNPIFSVETWHTTSVFVVVRRICICRLTDWAITIIRILI